MFSRSAWRDLARQLDWEFSYVRREDVFPEAVAGSAAVPEAAWATWQEPFKTSYAEYVGKQNEKETSVHAVREAVGRASDFAKLPPEWLSGLKLHAATLPLAEFAAVIGNLRAARFGRTSAWRTMSLFGALDETRHAQIPLLLMHELLGWDRQFDWTWKFFHSNNWVAIAARHLADELLLTADPIEFAIATHFVFETGFTNLQFVGLASMAHSAGDKMFEKMVTSIQTDEARHAQIGPAVLRILVEHDRARAQQLVDKWFWRSWLLFAVVTGFSMDYFTPLAARTQSFKEFMEEWVLDQFVASLEQYGLAKPWYWETFLASLGHYHHMVYASAYSYRASVWFDFVLPGPQERAWLRQKYPQTWGDYDPIWDRVTARWRAADIGNDFAVHATAIPTFCNLCQLTMSGGSPRQNSAVSIEHNGTLYMFCSEPCRWIFEQEPERYEAHKDLVKRVLAGEAPANLIMMLQQYFGLDYHSWGRDSRGGDYPFVARASEAPR
ncbi:MAG TPA: YHS domain-containing protein [Polyangia bacterium]